MKILSHHIWEKGTPRHWPTLHAKVQLRKKDGFTAGRAARPINEAALREALATISAV